MSCHLFVLTNHSVRAGRTLSPNIRKEDTSPRDVRAKVARLAGVEICALSRFSRNSDTRTLWVWGEAERSELVRPCEGLVLVVPVPVWARCSAVRRCAWPSCSCSPARRTSASVSSGSSGWSSSEMWGGFQHFTRFNYSLRYTLIISHSTQGPLVMCQCVVTSKFQRELHSGTNLSSSSSSSSSFP